jgi:dTDP-glucose 4,6-dehydratase
MLEHIGKAKLRRIEIHSGDLRDQESVRRAVRGCGLVFHLGALIGIPYSCLNPVDVVLTNVIGTLNVLEAVRQQRVHRVVQTSTSEVYGTARYVPMDEDHPLVPQSPYAATKVAGDKLAESYHRAYGLPAVVLRPFNTYGPRQSPRAVIPAIILQALEGPGIRLGNLGPRRDFTFVTDTARGFVAAATAEGVDGQTIQLGSQRETSVRELVELVGKSLNRKLRVVAEQKRRRSPSGEVERLYASNRRAADLLGWTPQVPLAQGLEKTINWFRESGRSYKSDLYHV